MPLDRKDMIMIAIAAVGGIGALWFYRNMSASQSSGDQSGAAFPYFQSAALPSSVGGTPTSVDPSGSATGTGSMDLTALVTQLGSIEQASQASAQAASFNTTGQSFLGQIAAQTNAQLYQFAAANPGSQALPVSTSGYINPRTDGSGGFTFGIQSMPLIFTNPGTFYNPPASLNSTNSLPPSNTLHDATYNV